MEKPIVNRFLSPDATVDNTFSFTYYGDQPYQNRIVITNTSDTTIYDNTISSMKFNQDVPANTLTNGTTYYIQFSVFDVDGNESSLSDKVLFTCYTTPTFAFADLSETSQNIIKASSYNAEINYYQEQGRNLKQYIFYLYDGARSLVYQTSVTYYSDESSISYYYKNLESSENYYIRCVGQTVDDIEVDTGYVELYPEYEYVSSYNMFEGKCVTESGYVELSTHIVYINGETEGTTIIEDGYVDVTNGKLIYSSGFEFGDQFRMTAIVKDVQIGELINMVDKYDNTLIVEALEYDDYTYFRLTYSNSFGKNIIYSDYYTLTTDTLVEIVVVRNIEMFDMVITIGS